MPGEPAVLRAFGYWFPGRDTQINILLPVGESFAQGRKLGIYGKPMKSLFFRADLNTSVQSHSHK